jgi:hypothetical protein
MFRRGFARTAISQGFLNRRKLFAEKCPRQFFAPCLQPTPVWHLIGGLDPIEDAELNGNEPKDDYPVLLRDWIRRDGLRCLKIKLRGNDAAWDYARIVRVGEMAMQENCFG